MTELPINQKEYLKKYLAIGKAPGEKKKKKKKPSTSSRVQIIDDDVVPTFTSNSTPLNDPIVIDEDAPQIVAIIDERPPSMRIDEKTNNPLWQPIGVINSDDGAEQKPMIRGFKIEPKVGERFVRPDKSPPRRKKKREDHSPPRSARDSPMRDVVIKEEIMSENGSPPRGREVDLTPPRRNKYTDDDYSPPRRKMPDYNDSSPPRRNKQRDDGDNSPPRRRRQIDHDISPPRRRKTEQTRGKYYDNSPPRKNRRKDRDFSPPRSSRGSNTDRSRSRSKYDNSPPKRIKEERDASPPRRRKEKDRERQSRWDNNSSPGSTRNAEIPKREEDLRSKTPDSSPPRKKKDKPEERSKKMEKTLDGKTAGLQNARELIEETRNFHSREDKLFQSLSTDVSGQNAQTVHRDRKTGYVRNLEEEEEFQRKKREEEEKNKEKYARWGRGLAQVENREQQLKDELHEMSKPLARYADDEDLEKYLKEQEREGDPMLSYIRKKKRKNAVDAGEVLKPQFEGQFMPNRYGIRPGHRWDGVDRSGGYEKKWFEVQNQKKAQLEDTYRWSTEDM